MHSLKDTEKINVNALRGRCPDVIVQSTEVLRRRPPVALWGAAPLWMNIQPRLLAPHLPLIEESDSSGISSLWH